MSLVTTTFGILKILILFVLILAIAIPFLYGSTNHQYITFRLLHSALTLKNSIVPDAARPTLSAEYRAIEDILRMNPISEFDPSKDPITSIKATRESFSIDNMVPKPSQCQINNEIFEYDGHTVNTYWVNYPARKFERKSDKLLLYFHGGGYMSGDIRLELNVILSQFLNRTIMHLEYRLCPEHPLPAAVDDAVALYQALLENNISPSQIMIMGDSAGGGLSLLTIQALIAREIPVPRGVIVLSPYADISASGESHKRNHDVEVMLRDAAVGSDNLLKILMGPNPSGLPPNNSIFSPLFGSFAGFSPMYINVGTAEILEDDSKGVFKKAQEAGVDVTFEEGLHMMHVYPLGFLYFPEARNTLDNILKWIESLE